MPDPVNLPIELLRHFLVSKQLLAGQTPTGLNYAALIVIQLVKRCRQIELLGGAGSCSDTTLDIATPNTERGKCA